MYVSLVEFVWIATNTAAVALQLLALRDAWKNRQAVKALNGRAREITAQGDVRRESFRIVVQALLLSAIVPGLFVDREIALTPAVVALLLVPVVLLASTAFDADERRQVNRAIEGTYR